MRRVQRERRVWKLRRLKRDFGRWKSHSHNQPGRRFQPALHPKDCRFQPTLHPKDHHQGGLNGPHHPGIESGQCGIKSMKGAFFMWSGTWPSIQVAGSRPANLSSSIMPSKKLKESAMSQTALGIELYRHQEQNRLQGTQSDRTLALMCLAWCLQV